MVWTTKELERFSNHIRRDMAHRGGDATLITPGLGMPNMKIKYFNKLKPFIHDIPLCHAIVVSTDGNQGDNRKIDVLLFAMKPEPIWKRVQEWTYEGQKNAESDAENHDEDEDEEEDLQDHASFIELMAEIRKQAKTAIEKQFDVTLTHNAAH